MTLSLQNWTLKDWILLFIPGIGNIIPLFFLNLSHSFTTEAEAFTLFFGLLFLLFIVAIITGITSTFHLSPPLVYFVYSLFLLVTVTSFAGLPNALFVWLFCSLIYLAFFWFTRLLRSFAKR